MRTYFKLIGLLRSPELINMIGEDYELFMLGVREENMKKEIWMVKQNMVNENKINAEKYKNKHKDHRRHNTDKKER